LAVAAALKAGPALTNIFGFNLLIFREEVCFSMEYCEMEHFDIDWSSLQRKLHLLHTLHIVHLDIKPENLGFSVKHNSFIFIDFGLSKVVTEEIGVPSVSAFAGSMNFCSEEMLELFLNDRSGLVDLYINDAICLDKTRQNVLDQRPDPQVL
jgi:serine/threonine protein kinase